MSAELLARIAGPVAAAGIVALYLGPWRPLRLAGLLATLAGAALCLPLLLPDRDRVLLVAAAAVALGLCCILAGVLLRWPWALPFLALLATPARIPVDIGGEQANLLLALYLVVGAGAIVLGWQLLRGGEQCRELGAITIPLALLAGWICLSVAWSDDRREAAVQLLFFYVPFSLLALLVARLPWRRSAPAGVYALLALLAVAFAGVGIVQWALRETWWNPKVEVGNAFSRIFRVNSVFWDPSIYGRFLAVAIVVSLGLLLLRSRAAGRGPLLAVIAVCWVGLLFSFSQSSLLALAAGTVVAAALAWGRRVVALVALVAVVLVPLVAFAPQFEHAREQVTNNLDEASSGRSGLVGTGIAIAGDHPLNGAGLGSFAVAYAREKGLFDRRGEPKPPAFARSHSSPVTVAAEQGVLGLAAFVALLVVALAVAFRPAADRGAAATTARIGGLVLCTVGVHSLFYSAFFEDPMTWASLGLVALASRGAADDSERVEVNA